ncbi:MAG: YggS family pyridoxal phosphate-dependent enzyme [Chitinophagaceae bacterium]|jgi:hypothetical protein|nr:YggS family pyridoxal phosphate-dependent enzyme [Chitinophagaceae bacterium]
MAVNKEAYQRIAAYCSQAGATLVAVSKTKPIEDILALYELGQRDFGENYVQELVAKQPQLPADIRWHFIGHLQSNKVKYIAPFVHLIHGIDSLKLLQEVNKQAAKCERIIDVLLQVHVAQEDTKFGLDEQELMTLLSFPQLAAMQHVQIRGLMAMASFTSDEGQLMTEFAAAKQKFDRITYNSVLVKQPHVLSMGMSGDYELAVSAGSNMVRVGSLLFGARHYPQ